MVKLEERIGGRTLLINEKRYQRKSPEALALECTVSHYLLYSDKPENVFMREEVQARIETELQKCANELAYQESAAKAMRNYVY